MNLLKTSPLFVLVVTLTGAAAPAKPTDRTSEIAVKDLANANASLATSGRFAAVAWGASTPEGATDVYIATSRDGGRRFGPPTRVNQVAGQARLSGEQPARIALVRRAVGAPSIVVVWTAKAGAETRLLSARSDDGGRSFVQGGLVPGSDAPGNRGWESIATTPDGGIVLLWLDHRELVSNTPSGAPMNHADHHHGSSAETPADGHAHAQLSKLFFARFNEPESSRALTGGVCYCCKTAIATDTAGGIYAAWRHVYDGDVRDIAFTKSSDGGRTFTAPARVSDDNWVLHGCPENGPALAVDDRKRAHVVWPTLVAGATSASEPTLALFYAMSQDGRRFTARQQIPTTGFPRHPQIALDLRGEVVVVWDEQEEGVRRIALARGAVDGNGTPRFVRQPVGDELPAQYPLVASGDGGTIVAWTSGSERQTVIRVERLAN